VRRGFVALPAGIRTNPQSASTQRPLPSTVLPEDRFATIAELRRELAAIQSEGAETAASEHLFDGCYELIELLGVGAKAEVWRAYHRDARCYVAIKILREEARSVWRRLRRAR